jgi:predicted nuclease of predicted toxin-antitoxin system
MTLLPKLLLDECISPWLVPHLWTIGVDTACLRDRGMLMRLDQEVWNLAQQEERALATINKGDFEAFADVDPYHHGLILIPSGGTRNEQLNYVTSAINFVKSTNNPDTWFRGRYLRVDMNGQTTMHRVDLPILPSEEDGYAD